LGQWVHRCTFFKVHLLQCYFPLVKSDFPESLLSCMLGLSKRTQPPKHTPSYLQVKIFTSESSLGFCTRQLLCHWKARPCYWEGIFHWARSVYVLRCWTGPWVAITVRCCSWLIFFLRLSYWLGTTVRPGFQQISVISPGLMVPTDRTI
jgi:hypothetical protein